MRCPAYTRWLRRVCAITRGDTYNDGNIALSQIQAQIDVLNRSYRGATGGAKTPFRFTLASVDRTLNVGWFNMAPGTGREEAMKTALRVGGANTLNIDTHVPGWGAPRGDQVDDTPSEATPASDCQARPRHLHRAGDRPGDELHGLHRRPVHGTRSRRGSPCARRSPGPRTEPRRAQWQQRRRRVPFRGRGVF